MSTALDRLAAEARRCRLCAADLPLGPRPVFRVSATARVLVVGQAPGTRVHETGIPWNDRSGDRLREWLGLLPEIFYDASRVAIVPMGFCYPGVQPGGGDRPPRPECARTWHGAILAHMPRVALTILAGRYAQVHYLGRRARHSVTETVRAWREYAPDYAPVPHPSWRTTAWQRRNPWFDEEVLPDLRRRVAALL